MKRLIPLLILAIALSSFQITQERNDFQGIVKYKITYTDVDERLSENYMCSLSGDSMIYYHDESGYLQSFYCKEQKIQTRWFNAIDNSLYLNNASEDTLYYYYANETFYMPTIEKVATGIEISGYNCDKYTVLLEPKKEYKQQPKIKYDFYLTTDLTIDISLFKNFEDGGYSKLLQKVPGLILKQTFYGPYYTRTRTATEVIKTNVEIEKHKPNRNLIKKKI